MKGAVVLRFVVGLAMAAAGLMVVDHAWPSPPISSRPPTGKGSGSSGHSGHSGGHSSGFNITIPIIPSIPIRPVQPSYTPQPQYYTPPTTTTIVTPPANVQPLPNELPPPPIAPCLNVCPFPSTYTLVADDLQQMLGQTRARNGRAIAAIVRLLGGAAAELIKSIKGLQAPADAGTLEMAILIQIGGQIKVLPGLSPANLLSIETHLATLGFNSEFIRILGTAVPGENPIPRGGDVTIILVPGMPLGVLLPLGNGAVLVGTGTGRGGIIVGTGNVFLAAGMGAIGPPVREAADAQPTSSGTVIRNRNDVTINYTVNDSAYSMANGFSQALAKGGAWVVAFDKGGSLGTARYTLDDGTYDFTSTQEQGWDLYRQSFEVTIDNSQSSGQFNYLLNNQRQVIGPRQKAVHKNDYPIVVRFDNGKGQVRQKQIDQGVFKVAITDDGTLDLFPPNSMPNPTETASEGLPAGFKMFANPFVKKGQLAANASSAGGSSVNLFGADTGTP